MQLDSLDKWDGAGIKEIRGCFSLRWERHTLWRRGGKSGDKAGRAEEKRIPDYCTECKRQLEGEGWGGGRGEGNWVSVGAEFKGDVFILKWIGGWVSSHSPKTRALKLLDLHNQSTHTNSRQHIQAGFPFSPFPRRFRRIRLKTGGRTPEKWPHQKYRAICKTGFTLNLGVCCFFFFGQNS